MDSACVRTVVLLGIIGLVMTRKHRDGALAVMWLMAVLSVSLFFVVSRYRTPMVGLLAIYAGAALDGGGGPIWDEVVLGGSVGLD